MIFVITRFHFFEISIINMLEVDLAKLVVSHFSKDYDVYQEVKACSSRVIDIVVRKKSGLMAIETKVMLNMKLWEQAFKNKKWCNYSFIAIPQNIYRKSRRKMISGMCRGLNIGVIVVDFDGNVSIQYNPAQEIPTQTLKLYDEQKSFALAGSGGVPYFTPFKKTVSEIKKYLEEHGKSELVTVIQSINHHYKTEQSAIQSIRKYALKGVMKGVVSSEDGRYLELS